MTSITYLAEALAGLAVTAPFTYMVLSSILALLAGAITQLAFGDYT